jgi:exopolysaccharide production protein ExoZ
MPFARFRFAPLTEHGAPSFRIKLAGQAAKMSQIGSIQMLRAVAALLVVFGHLEHEALTLPAAAAFGFAPIILDLTGAGVDLFFVISGFVMVYASRDLFQTPDGPRRFLTRRVARIVPLYWAITTLFLLTLALTPNVLSSGAPTSIEILKSYVFIPYLHPGAEMLQPVYKLGWTLNYEMFFYVAFSCVLILPMRAAILVIALVFSGLAALGLWLSPAPGVVSFWTHPIILEFVMGAFIAALHLNGRRFGTAQVITIVLAGILGFALAAASGLDAHGSWRPLLWGVPAAAILMGSTLRETSPSSPGSKRWIVALGDASYAIYLLHPLVIRVLRLVWDRIHASSDVSPWIFVILGFAIVLPLSVLVHRRFERPMTKRAQWLLGTRSKVSPPARPYRNAYMTDRATQTSP